MPDDADIAQARIEAEEEMRRLQRDRQQPAFPSPDGSCLYCGEDAPDVARFCCVDCRIDWDQERNILARQGRA